MASPGEKHSGDELSLQEIVFSCGTCQATVSEVYASKESNRGFHSGSGHEDGIVTKLWIAECSHITCGKHLEGGAIPFHPKGMQPRASCPQCMERGDDGLKDMYGIRGLEEGGYDATIPVSFMECPPIKLDGAVPGMDALRFQYMSLARYARRVTAYWKDAQHKQQALEAAHSKERKERRRVQSEVLELKAREQEFESTEAGLRKWEGRKPVINHYLAAVGEMARDIEAMRSQLSQLGYQVPECNYAFEPDRSARPQSAAAAAQQRRDRGNVAAEYENSSSSRKRKVADYDAYGADTADGQPFLEPHPRVSSRDLMPPPLKVSNPHQHAMPRGSEPVPLRYLRRPSTSRQSTRAHKDQPRTSSHQMETRDDRGRGDNVLRQAFLRQASVEHRTLPFTPSPVHETQLRAVPEGALPIHDTHRYERRAPPIAATNSRSPYQPLAQLSIGPPQRHKGLVSRPVEFSSALLQSTRYPQGQSGARTTRYDADHGTVAQQRDDQVRKPLQPFSASYLNRQPGMSSQVGQPSAVVPPQRQSQPSAASVISPFFKRGHGAISRPTGFQRPPAQGSFVSPHYASRGLDTATSHSLAPSHHDTSHTHGQWPSLNGLSFMERPGRPAERQTLYHPPNRPEAMDDKHIRQSMIPQTPRNSQGLFQRPDRPSAPASYESSRPQSTTHRSRISFVPGQQPRSSATSQEQALSQIRGVRGISSQGVRLNNYENGLLYDPGRMLYSSAGGRRSVRR